MPKTYLGLSSEIAANYLLIESHRAYYGYWEHLGKPDDTSEIVREGDTFTPQDVPARIEKWEKRVSELRKQRVQLPADMYNVLFIGSDAKPRQLINKYHELRTFYVATIAQTGRLIAQERAVMAEQVQVGQLPLFEVLTFFRSILAENEDHLIVLDKVTEELRRDIRQRSSSPQSGQGSSWQQATRFILDLVLRRK